MPCGIVRLCGITSRFQLLFPSTRQVIHALLTRPPLWWKSIRKYQIITVRLACVRHAASVHPEPGSNSHVKNEHPVYNGMLKSSSILVRWPGINFLRNLLRSSFRNLLGLVRSNFFSEVLFSSDAVFEAASYLRSKRNLQGCISVKLSYIRFLRCFPGLPDSLRSSLRACRSCERI